MVGWSDVDWPAVDRADHSCRGGDYRCRAALIKRSGVGDRRLLLDNNCLSWEQSAQNNVSDMDGAVNVTRLAVMAPSLQSRRAEQ